MDDEEPHEPVATPALPEALRAARRAADARFEVMRTFGQVGTIGLSFVLAIGLGTMAGWWLDSVTGFSPWFLVTFFVLGVVAGIRNVYATTKRFLK